MVQSCHHSKCSKFYLLNGQKSTVSPPHTNLQVMSFQRWDHISLDCFSKRADRIESSKEPEPVPSTSGVSEIAACPLSPVADDPSALSFPTSSPSSRQWLSLPVRLMPALYASCCTVLFYFSKYYTVRLKYFRFVCFLCIICVKSTINLFQHSTV